MIKNLTLENYKDYLKFNSEVYPYRNNNEERFNFQFLENPLLVDKTHTFSLLAYNEENKIVGEYGVNPFNYHLDNRINCCFCGCDLFVLEKYRPRGIGSLLSIKAIKTYKPHISIGISKEAYPILSFLNMKEVGEVCTYIWLRSLYGLVRGVLSFVSGGKLLKKNNWDKKRYNKRVCIFPSKFSVKTFTFEEDKSFTDWVDQGSDSDIFEFSRSLAFIKWRFNHDRGYHLYTSCSGEGNSYFVVKEIYWKGMSILSLVDYRTTLKNENKEKMFKHILNATKYLARFRRNHGVITMSSNSFFDKCLKNKFFLKVGKPYLMMVNGDIIFPKEKITKREAVFVTMADSDLEFSFH